MEASSTVSAQAGSSSSSYVSGAVSLTVTSDVQAWSNGAGNYGWVILPWTNGTDGWAFFSDSYSDASMHEKLSVTYTPPASVPEPASLAGLAGGMVLALTRRRRRLERERDTRNLAALAQVAGASPLFEGGCL